MLLCIMSKNPMAVLVVNIKEFSSVPDENYLKLPEALKDVTKYDKEGK